MLSRSQNSCGRVAIVRLALIALLCSVGTFTAAEDQPTPKWELYAPRDQPCGVESAWRWRQRDVQL